MNKSEKPFGALEKTLSALALSSSLAACGSAQDMPTRVLMRHFGQKVGALNIGDCTADGNPNKDGTPAKISCTNTTTSAYFHAAPDAHNHVTYDYRYGVPTGKTPADSQKSPHLSLVVSPGEVCQTMSAHNIQTRLNPPEFTDINCDSAASCTVEKRSKDTESVEHDQLSPEDSESLCRTMTMLMQGMHRAVSPNHTELAAR